MRVNFGIYRIKVALSYQQALHKINKAIDLFNANTYILRLKAMTLVGLGDNVTALDSCDSGLKLDSKDSRLFLLKGLIQLDLQRWSEAENSFKSAIYFNPNYAEAHFHLGNLLLRQSKGKAGMDELKAALAIAKKSDSNKLVDQAHETTYHAFARSIEEQLDIYRGASWN